MRGLPWVVLAVLASGLVWLFVAESSDSVGESGQFPVSVTGPGGLIWNGTVEANDATVLQALHAASTAGGFDVVQEGAGASAFVTAVAGFANKGAGGWCFETFDAGWHFGTASAGAIGLRDGQASRWTYRFDGCPV